MTTPLAQHQRPDRTDQVFHRMDIMIWELNVLIAMMVAALLLVH